MARDIMGWAALIYGVFGLALVIAAFVLRGLAAARAPGVIELTAVAAVSLAFGYSVRRPPVPPFWWLAMIYCGASPTLALTRIGGFTAPRWPQVVAGVVVGALWLLYFARRRPMYGLKPWRGTF
jgi:hypothetical protein